MTLPPFTPDFVLWQTDRARARDATDAAIARAGRGRTAAQTIDVLAAALPRRMTRGQLLCTLHLRDAPDAAARQAGRLALSGYALQCHDIRRAQAELETFLDDPCRPGPAATDTALARLCDIRLKLGDRAAALALNDRRRGHARAFDLGIRHARIVLSVDPQAALAALAACGADAGRGGPRGNGLSLSALLATGDVDGVTALARRIEGWPRCTLMARAHLHNLTVARTGDAAGLGSVLEALRIRARAVGGFDDIVLEAQPDAAPNPRHGPSGAANHGPNHGTDHGDTDRPPLVSVVMTAFDAADHVATAMRSILAQTWRHLELIVVDDRSTDRTWDRMTAVAAGDPRVRLLRTARNGGTYLAKNLGIGAARGRFVALCDADDMWTPDHIAAHMAPMTEEPLVQVSSSDWLRILQDGRVEIAADGAIVERCPHSTFFRAEIFARVGLFDSVRIGADREFLHRVALEYGRGSTLHLRRVLTLGRRHGASLTTSGAGAIAIGHPPEIRQIYRHIWTGWQIDQVVAGRPLYNAGDPGARPYAVPDAMS